MNLVIRRLFKSGDFEHIKFDQMNFLFREHVLKNINLLRNAAVQKMKIVFR